MLLILVELEELLDWDGAEKEEDDPNFELVMIVDGSPGTLSTTLELVDTEDILEEDILEEDILEEDILDAGTNDFAVELRLLLTISLELELLEPVKLPVLLEEEGMNCVAAKFRPLLAIGGGLELPEELVKLPELLEGYGVENGGGNGDGDKLLLGWNEVGYSEVGGTYEGANDDGNISGNTYAGGWGGKLLPVIGPELELPGIKLLYSWGGTIYDGGIGIDAGNDILYPEACAIGGIVNPGENCPVLWLLELIAGRFCP
jgi:hypothetical protein